MKVMIIGYSGSGKSTLAKRIGESLRIPVLYLDTVNFLPGWIQRDGEESKRIVKEFLDTNTSWIIDGNYKSIYMDRRLEEADEIVFANFSRIKCLYYAYKRYRQNKNRVRESSAEGCVEKFDKEFILWILKDGRTKTTKKFYANVCQKYKEKVSVCRNHTDMNAVAYSITNSKV